MFKNLSFKKITPLFLIFAFVFYFTIPNCFAEYQVEGPSYQTDGQDLLNDNLVNQNIFRQTSGFGSDTPQTPTTIIISIIQILLGFLGLIFLVLIIITGFQWMTSGGNDELINKAKSRLKNALIGLAIVLASYIIVHTIITILKLSTTSSGLVTW